MDIEKIIRKMIMKELYSLNGSNSVYSSFERRSFPYDDKEKLEAIPQDIKANDYVMDWNSISQNQSLHAFPMEDFKKGLQIEAQRNPEFNILEVSEKVIQNLKLDKSFYSKLK